MVELEQPPKGEAVVLIKEEEDLNEWLPITGSRNAKWYYSAFHNITAMVGAGVLGLPYAMSELGWYAIHIQLCYIIIFLCTSETFSYLHTN